MELSEAKIRFEAGDLAAVEAHRTPLSEKEGWELILTRRNGAKAVLRAYRSSEAREFRTLDTAAKTAREIGFRALGVAL